MEEELSDVVPCSSLAVDSILRVGTVTKKKTTIVSFKFNFSSSKSLLFSNNIEFYFRQVQFGDCVLVQPKLVKEVMLTKLN